MVIDYQTLILSFPCSVPVSIIGPAAQFLERHQFDDVALTVTLDRRVNPMPPPANVTWLHPTNVILTSGGRYTFSADRRTLTISRAQPSDDGLYTAIIFNGVGNPATAFFNLTVFSE